MAWNTVEDTFAFRLGSARETAREEGRNGLDGGINISSEDILEWLREADNSYDSDMDEIAENEILRRQGWKAGYHPQAEFLRMGLSERWILTGANESFDLSPTYGQYHIIPKNYIQPLSPTSRSLAIPDASHGLAYPPPRRPHSPAITTPSISHDRQRSAIHIIASYRTKRRFPSVCWKNPAFHQVLIRSSQPKTGLLRTRSRDDELLISELIDANRASYISTRCHAESNGETALKFWIFDARSYAAARGNEVLGGGSENPMNYPPGTELQFLALPNIHTIASSYEALMKGILTSGDSPTWFSVLESTNWLQNVADVLRAVSGPGGIVSRMVEEKASVIVHCSDGWDRTSQLISLTEILLDPYYRTIEGLHVLLDREWLSYGHPFNARTDLPPSVPSPATSPPTDEPNESVMATPHRTIHAAASPIFILFLTCLHHIVEQFPTEFEYNDALLVVLAKCVMGNGPFGDFLCNNEYERSTINLRQRTYSLWSFIHLRKPRFINPTYRRPALTCSCKSRRIASFYPSSSSRSSLPPQPCSPQHCCYAEWSSRIVLRPSFAPRMLSLWSGLHFGGGGGGVDDVWVGMLGCPDEMDESVQKRVEEIKTFITKSHARTVRSAFRFWRAKSQKFNEGRRCGTAHYARTTTDSEDDEWIEVGDVRRASVAPEVNVVWGSRGGSQNVVEERGLLERQIEEAMGSRLEGVKV
ncbi:hypothetical protein HDV00_002963 [Rhizophlyctis rosea]|nr:hypothetical protein HDV00_002963 [Rhizophlyctis rosea]